MRFFIRHERMIKIVTGILLIALFVFFTYKTITKKEIHTESNVYAGTAFGTAVKKTFYLEDSSKGDEINNEINQYLKDLENQISVRVVGSEIYRCNVNNICDGKYELSPNIVSYLEREMEIFKESDGAFSPCIRPLSSLWGIEDGAVELPDEKEIKKTLKLIDGNDMELYDKGVIFHKADMKIDLGAVGKGIACDGIREILKENQVVGAVVSVGGSICVFGDKGDGKDWNIGIQDPRKEQGEVFGVVEVSGDKTISTSGDYEKYFMSNDKRYHHILDPKTGYPVDNGLMSVTVICDNGLDSDAYSTACFVLGLDDGMKLAEKKGFDAIFVTEDKSVYITDGLKKKFNIRSDSYKLKN